VTLREEQIEIDFSVIEDLADGDPAALAELTATFVRHTTDGIAKVRAAIDSVDFAQAIRVTHTCIGFTATIGIAGLVPILRELEAAAKEARREELARLLALWEQGFERVRRTLQARLSRNT